VDLSSLPNYLTHVSYAGIFGLLAFLDAFIPVPEEFVLLGIGYAAAFEALNETAVVAISLSALLIGDNISFWFARAGGRWLDRLTQRLGKAFPGRYADRMRTHAGKTLIVMTLIPNVRFFAPIVAGSLQTPWRRFFLFDAPGVLLYVGIYLTLGYHSHRQMDRLTQAFDTYRHVAVYALLLVLVMGIGVARHRSQARQAVGR